MSHPLADMRPCISIPGDLTQAREFSEYLLRIGDGREPTYNDIGEGIVWVPDDMLEPSQTLKGLISDIYGDLAHRHQDKQYMSERTILILQNRDVDSTNDMIMQLFPGEVAFDPSIIAL